MPNESPGRLQVIAGPMFAGKSEELLRRVRRARLAGLAVEVVSHALDQRHGTGRVASHAGASTSSHAATDVASLLDLIGGRDLDLLAIDEAQFFGPDLLRAVGDLLGRGMSVVVAGLCVTYDARPFEPLPSLMALAEEVVKLTAVCAICGRDAAFHQPVRPDDDGDALVPTVAAVGGTEAYQARCRVHLRLRRVGADL